MRTENFAELQFMDNVLYLDNHTVTRPLPKVIETLEPFFRERWGNVKAPHRLGQELISAVDKAAENIKRSLGAAPSSTLLFASSGAEAIDHLFFSVYTTIAIEVARTHFFFAETEEIAVLMGLKQLKKFDCYSKALPVDEVGRLRAETLEEIIDRRGVMLSVSMAHPLTGVIQPIADLARVCKAKDILLHVDISSAFGKLFFSFEDFGVDFLTFEGSLFHAPKGTGGLLVRTGLSLPPIHHGVAPFNVPLFSALGCAMEEMQNGLDYMCTEIARLRGRFEEKLQAMLPDIVVFFQEVDRLPNTSVIAFPKIASELLAFHLQRRGVFATFGGESYQHLSVILKACGVEPSLAMSALSFALSCETTEEEIDRAVLIIAELVEELQKLSRALE